MKNFIAEFKKFAMRGNVLDMAVGVIIGGAFNSIVTSLVNDIISPLLAIPLSEVNFAEMSLNLGGAVITYGNFIQTVISFLITAFSVFVMVKAVNMLAAKKSKEEAKETPTPKISVTDQLLTEILAKLKEKKS